jgi:hypothetical protein
MRTNRHWYCGGVLCKFGHVGVGSGYVCADGEGVGVLIFSLSYYSLYWTMCVYEEIKHGIICVGKRAIRLLCVFAQVTCVKPF